MQKRNQIIYFNVLNILSCISVIAMHVNSASWIYTGNLEWGGALAVEVICYFAVPIFFMLSGATLMNYRERYSTRLFLSRRIKRIFIPFCIWSILYLIFNWVTGTTKEITPKVAIEVITAYSSQPIFWFLHAILNIYLCMPLLSLMAGKRWENLRWYLIILGFTSKILFPLIVQWTAISFGTNSGLYIMDGYLIYVLLGYQLSQTDISKKWLYISLILGVLAYFVRYFGTIICSAQAGTLSTIFYGYLTIWALLPACAIFLLMKALEGKFQLFQSGIKDKISLLSSLSFGVYLIHKLVMAAVVKLFHLNMYELLYQIIGPIIVYVISCIIISILKQVPFIKHIVP